MNIKDYGFKDNINTDKTIARIVATHKDRYEIVCNEGQGFAQIKEDAITITQIAFTQQQEILLQFNGTQLEIV